MIFNIEYFIESSKFSELPSVFNSVTSVEFPNNHLLYFLDFTQLNSPKDTPYFYTPIFYLVFTPLLFTFLLSEYNSNNRKITLSLKRSKHQPRTKKKFFSNKTKSHHFSFTTCFIICKLILVYYLLAYKSKPKQDIHVSSLIEYKFDGLGFSKIKIKNNGSFFKFAFLLSGDIQLNPGPTTDVCLVWKTTLNKVFVVLNAI